MEPLPEHDPPVDEVVCVRDAVPEPAALELNVPVIVRPDSLTESVLPVTVPAENVATYDREIPATPQLPLVSGTNTRKPLTELPSMVKESGWLPAVPLHDPASETAVDAVGAVGAADVLPEQLLRNPTANVSTSIRLIPITASCMLITEFSRSSYLLIVNDG